MRVSTIAGSIALSLAAVMLSIAAGALFTWSSGRGAEAPPLSAVAAARTGSSPSQSDDAQFFADLRAARRADRVTAARAYSDRARWFAAVRGPTLGQVLVFFDVLLRGRPLEPAPDPAPARLVVASPPAPTATSVPQAPPAAPQVWIEEAFTRAVWDTVNARRALVGLGFVTEDARLTRAATDYALLMSEMTWFSHTGPDGSSFVERIVAAGFPFEGQVGEILALGTSGWPAADVVQAWMDSPQHREQMLNPAYRLAGIGCAFTHDDGALTVRCAMEFAA